MSLQPLAALRHLAIAALVVAATVGNGPRPVAAQQGSVTTTTTPTTPTATTTPVTPADCKRTALDSFARPNTNDFDFARSDDGTTTDYRVAGGVLSFVPAANGSSYVYEDLGCLSTTTAGRFIVFTLQTNSNIRFAIQLQDKCGAEGTSRNVTINGPPIMGTFPQATTVAVDTQSYLSLAGSTNVWSVVFTQMSTITGTAPWSISALLAASTLPCGFDNITLVTQSDVTPNWSSSMAESACKRVAVDSFMASGANNLGVVRSDEQTMTTFTVADGQATMVPRANGTSYWYEEITVGNKSFSLAGTPFLVFSVQTSAPTGSFQLNVEHGSIGGASQLTLATLTPGTTAKTYVIPLTSYLTATQLQSVLSFSWNTFRTDGTSAWMFKGLSLVSNYTMCGVPTPTLVTPTLAPSGCTKLSVNLFMLSCWIVLISVLFL
ncbi:hypothetical protein BDZ88DRAFT_429001 [Geranomyces variabilis]|nr:hypothetical protein BDZ88DRAFT_429001 [Geranomyces variabilis]KAJ3138543.1 hypothetical protein HDU90_000984 [Geranomyces variabilis]